MWPAIIALLIDRAAAGFPILSELLRRRKPELVQLAREVEPADGPNPHGAAAAPPELKHKAVEFLKRMRDRASGTTLKFVIGLLIQFLPLLGDEVWDTLFPAAQQGGGSLATLAAAGAAGPASAEATAFADACDAVNID